MMDGSSLALAIFAFFVAIIVYQVFVSDQMEEWRESRKENTSADKIARLKLLSDDSKEIEKFIVANAAHLSNESVNQLLARLETLYADKVINDDAARFRVTTETLSDDAETLSDDAASLDGYGWTPRYKIKE